MGGFAVGFTKGWRLSLVLLSCIPLVVVAGGILSIMISKMSSRAQIAYAEAGNVVEQTVGAIRTVRHRNQLQTIYIWCMNFEIIYVCLLDLFRFC